MAINPNSKTIFEWPPSSKLKEYMSKGIHLIGFENNTQYGTGSQFNWILSNEDRSTQRDIDDPTKYSHMIPSDAIKKIGTVIIHYSDWILGFSFFDKDGAHLWDIGDTDHHRWSKKETVVLAENKVILGVVAKLYPGWKSRYTDF